MRKLFQAILWGLAILLGVVGVSLLNPEFDSKVHGYLLTALGFIFLIQDGIFGFSHRRLDELGKSTAVPISRAETMLERVRQLKRRAWRIFFFAIISRVLLVVLGQLLQYAENLKPFFFHSYGLEISRAKIYGWVGYGVVMLGVLLIVKTHSIFAHAETVLGDYELRARQEAEGKAQAKDILDSDSKSDWKTDPSLSSYPKAKIRGLGR